MAIGRQLARRMRGKINFRSQRCLRLLDSSHAVNGVHKQMSPLDPHSHADAAHPGVTDVSLRLYLNFSSTTVHGAALLRLPGAYSGPLFLDTRSLIIHAVQDPETKLSLPFSLSEPDPIKGSLLNVSLTGQLVILIGYSTTSSSSALQWLSPAQTFNRRLPFVYTQCQSIHARSLFPCQDTPAVRIRYSACLNIPRTLSAVMSAKNIASGRQPSMEDVDGYAFDKEFCHSWCSEGRAVEEFTMEQPIPPYLFALAAGELDFVEVGPRTRVYSEAVPHILDMAKQEFTGTEDLIREGERLFGEYEWERFDLLVLPASFPFGGMENPRMVFLTPTVMKGDGSGFQVVAHELAHSWTGNLITNINNEHFWLNEGFTTYAERRIVEAVQGEEIAALNMGIGWRGLNEEMERFKDNMEFTKLMNRQDSVHPDDVYSQVPYEKGFQFLWRIERQVGREAFDEFLRKYTSEFKFRSIDTQTFLKFLRANFSGIENNIDLKSWTEGTSIPPDAQEPVSDIYRAIVSLAKAFGDGRIPTWEEVASWRGQEWELYLDNLPKQVQASQVMELDSRHRLSESKDYDVKVAFLQLAIATGCRMYYGEVERTLKEIGRMRYLRPLFTFLVQGPGRQEEKMLAKRVFAEARDRYHPIAQSVVESIFARHLEDYP